MKNFLALLFFGLLIAGGIYAFNIPFSFCDVPQTYKIGSIDPRFNLKQTKAMSDINEAAEILDAAYGKKLFTYSTDSGELTINFVYDERTALDSRINSEESKLSKVSTALQAKIDTYENDVKIFLEKVANFNATIQKFNDAGGAPQVEFDKLVAEQKLLKAEGDALNARAKALNLETHDYNSGVQNLNQNVSVFNNALIQKPEEGYYDGENKIISIYFVNSKPELVHTLAHEFGHALGMGHVEDPNAIMYLQTSENLEFTKSDKQELDRVCQSFPLPEYWIYKLRLELFNLTKILLNKSS